jgi:hypothetical protein
VGSTTVEETGGSGVGSPFTACTDEVSSISGIGSPSAISGLSFAIPITVGTGSAGPAIFGVGASTFTIFTSEVSGTAVNVGVGVGVGVVSASAGLGAGVDSSITSSFGGPPGIKSNIAFAAACSFDIGVVSATGVDVGVGTDSSVSAGDATAAVPANVAITDDRMSAGGGVGVDEKIPVPDGKSRNARTCFSVKNRTLAFAYVVNSWSSNLSA